MKWIFRVLVSELDGSLRGDRRFNQLQRRQRNSQNHRRLIDSGNFKGKLSTSSTWSSRNCFPNNHFAAISDDNQSLVIYPRDGSWSVEVVVYQLVNFFYVHHQLILQQFDLNPKSSSPKILSAEFQWSQLVLSRRGSHGGALRCRLYDCRLGPENVNYVDQTTRWVGDDEIAVTLWEKAVHIILCEWWLGGRYFEKGCE